jgi:hypothetical protein
MQCCDAQDAMQGVLFFIALVPVDTERTLVLKCNIPVILMARTARTDKSPQKFKLLKDPAMYQQEAERLQRLKAPVRQPVAAKASPLAAAGTSVATRTTSATKPVAKPVEEACEGAALAAMAKPGDLRPLDECAEAQAWLERLSKMPVGSDVFYSAFAGEADCALGEQPCPEGWLAHSAVSAVVGDSEACKADNTGSRLLSQHSPAAMPQEGLALPDSPYPGLQKACCASDERRYRDIRGSAAAQKRALLRPPAISTA